VSQARRADVVEHRHPFADTRWRPVPRGVLDAAVDATCRALHDGEVLVRCRMGANRSPLVAALVLRQAGRSPGQAIDDVRRARGPLALSNPYFRDLVHCWPDDPMTRPT
jgi:protein-tyrosine phosphatase